VAVSRLFAFRLRQHFSTLTSSAKWSSRIGDPPSFTL
jgi:hypothetical protein